MPLLGCCRYWHVDRAVFLLEPEKKGWGLVRPGEVPLASGQTYAALLADRPLNYLTHRVFQPKTSTVG